MHTRLLCRKCYNRRYHQSNIDYAREYARNYTSTHREQIHAYKASYRLNHGGKPMGENKSCSAYLGVHVAERVLSKVFKDVERMPYNHIGYDFICNRGMKIDVKSSTIHVRQDRNDLWTFNIRKNTTADHFLCIAYDNRVDLTPMHVWLVPGDIINDVHSVAVSVGAPDKFREYELDIAKTAACCDDMRG